MDTEILNTLKEIRGILWVLLFFVGTLIIFLLTNVFRDRSFFKSMEKTMVSQHWRDDAQTLFLLGNYEELIEYCDNRLNQYPEDTTAYWWKGRAYMRLGKSKKAIEYFERIKDIDPGWGAKNIEPYIKKIKSDENDVNRVTKGH